MVLILNFAVCLEGSLLSFFALSKDSLRFLRPWQVLSSSLLFPLSPASSNYLGFFFKIFLFWLTAKHLIFNWGQWAFFRFLTLSSIIASLSALHLLAFFDTRYYFGFEAALHSSLLAAALLAKRQSLFLSDYSLRDLFLVLLAFECTFSMLQGQFLNILTSAAALIFSYLYLQMQGLKSGFPPFRALERLFASLQKKRESEKKRQLEIQEFMQKRGKIFDFKTGEAIFNDEDFLNIMQLKTQTYGSKALSKQEKRRLRQLSKV